MMSGKFSREPLRGMKDFYPEDMREVNWILSVIEEIADLYCYEEYEAPLLEPIEIFEAKSSDELVNEQSFIVEKKKGERLILRPELTPSLARMIARRFQELKKPIRWYSVPNCYRYERPQKGRRREFKQVNFDILGENSLYAELEIFNIIIDILTGFGATGKQFQILYNNRRFIDAVCKYILDLKDDKMKLVYKILDKADKMDETEFEKWLIESFENDYVIQGIYKLKEAKSLDDLLNKFEEIPEIFYESSGYKELKKLNQLIIDAGIDEYCTFAPKIVRGLDYYTGTVFEVFDMGGENKRAIFGGGRYDDLLTLFSKDQLSGVGFGMGVLMLSLFLKTYNLIPEDIYNKDYSDTVYIASVNEQVAPYAYKIAKIIRDENIPCMIDYRFKNLKNQFKKANEYGIPIVIILGPKEMEQNKITIKNMFKETQKTVPLKEMINEIYKIFDENEI